MHSNKPVEHFVTLFDSNYLPLGMCLHASLMEQAQPFRLWIVCMDELVERQLHQLALPCVSLLPLRDVETDELLTVKGTRSRGEYCWTLTPFTPQFVFESDPDIERVTYVDADLFFFRTPDILLKEFEESGKHVLITEHAFADRYKRYIIHGRFCVQFMTFRRTIEAQEVIRWWQERCIEWCYWRYEDGKFGDQGYLDSWPDRFPQAVHILKQVDKTLAPWNLSRFAKNVNCLQKFVFYHFHSLKIVGENKVILYLDYNLEGKGGDIYAVYLKCMNKCTTMMKSHDMLIPVLSQKPESLWVLRLIKRKLLNTIKTATINQFSKL
jgi:hypothetical protein